MRNMPTLVSWAQRCYKCVWPLSELTKTNNERIINKIAASSKCNGVDFMFSYRMPSNWSGKSNTPAIAIVLEARGINETIGRKDSYKKSMSNFLVIKGLDHQEQDGVLTSCSEFQEQ